MKSDLDTLMQSKNLDAFLVVGNADHNPPMYYLTGGGHFGGAALIKKRGEKGRAVLQRHGARRSRQQRAGYCPLQHLQL